MGRGVWVWDLGGFGDVGSCFLYFWWEWGFLSSYFVWMCLGFMSVLWLL